MSQEPRPSATVVLVRDKSGQLELLLLERRPRKAGEAPGPWVFPGGKVDDVDIEDHSKDEIAEARRAAVREVMEESGLQIGTDQLVPISRWITPSLSPRRFDTWFFIAAAPPEQSVKVDGDEIARHRWMTAADALKAHHEKTISLAPPTFVTTTWVRDYRNATEAIDRLGQAEFLTFRPKICQTPEGTAMLYPGDAGYPDSDPDQKGSRHRLWALQDGYRYERDV
jgi:8-oxo-dGTP pyrophosphatase MutT (NUDIX family)